MGFIDETFELNSGEAGITESDPNGANWVSDVWDFKVPLNTFIVLRPTDVFGCNLVGDDAAAMPNTTQIRILRADVANTERKPVLTALPYKQVQEFQDKKKMMRLSIVKEVIVGPDEHLIVQINGADAATTGDTDASASYFKLKTTRRRKALD